jgi:hypothetical protein
MLLLLVALAGLGAGLERMRRRSEEYRILASFHQAMLDRDRAQE